MQFMVYIRIRLWSTEANNGLIKPHFSCPAFSQPGQLFRRLPTSVDEMLSYYTQVGLLNKTMDSFW